MRRPGFVPILIVLLTLALAAQPGGPPVPPGGGGAPGPGPAAPGPGSGSAGSSTPAMPPHFVGTLSSLGSMFISAQKEGQGGPLNARMEFRVDDKTILSKGLKSRDRVLILYQNAANGRGYLATAVLRFPTGTDPQELMKSLPSDRRKVVR